MDLAAISWLIIQSVILTQYVPLVYHNFQCIRFQSGELS